MRDYSRCNLRGSPDGIQLTVSDLGVGFDPQEAVNGQGLGLINMRETLQLVGRQLSIRSAVGCGTTILGHVPVKPEKHDVVANISVMTFLANNRGLRNSFSSSCIVRCLIERHPVRRSYLGATSGLHPVRPGTP